MRRIRADLEHVARSIGRADPHARALILTGGFSRGEGTIRHDTPVNDYDLICVRSRPGGARLMERLSTKLSEEIDLHLDLHPIWSARLGFVGRKLFWLDARLGGRVIAGDPGALGRIRVFGPEDIPGDEVARLLGNRAAGLLFSLPVNDEPEDPHQRDLQATKAVLAAMDATLLHQRTYAAKLRERLALLSEHPDEPLFATAVDWKLRGEAALPKNYWDQAAQCLLRAVEATGSRRIRDGATAHAFYAARARRVRFGPSRRVREAAWDLLAQTSWPLGPTNAPWVMLRLGAVEPTWTRVKSRFFAMRAQTLQ